MKTLPDNRLIRTITSSIVLFSLLLISSYNHAKSCAEEFVLSTSTDRINLPGELILFVDSSYKPRWLFSGEHPHVLSGAKFDVCVSIFGKILNKKELLNTHE